MFDINADDLSAIAAIATVGSTLLVAFASGIWAVKKWSSERKLVREQEVNLARERMEQQRIEERHRREDKVAELVIALGSATTPEAKLWAANALSLYPDQTLPLMVLSLGHSDEATSSVMNIALASIGIRALPELTKMNRAAQTIVAANAIAASTQVNLTAEPVDADRAMRGEHVFEVSSTPDSGAQLDKEDQSVPAKLEATATTSPDSNAPPEKTVQPTSAEKEITPSRPSNSTTRAQEDDQIIFEHQGDPNLSDPDRDVEPTRVRGAAPRFERADVVGAHQMLECTRSVIAYLILLSDDKLLRYLDLAGVDLQSMSFAAATLDGVRFRKASLEGAVFARARLNKSNFRGAKLNDAVFLEATARQADFTGIHGPVRARRLVAPNAKFENAKLGQSRFDGAQLQNCSFLCTDMNKTHLPGANLAGSTITEGNWGGIKAFKSNMKECKFTNVILEVAELNESHIERSRFTRKCRLVGLKAFKLHAQGAYFEDCGLGGAKLIEADLRGASFVRRTLGGVKLMQANLEGCTFDSCTFSSASFAGADLKNARFKGVQTADPSKFDASAKNWRQAVFEKGSESVRKLFEQAEMQTTPETKAKVAAAADPLSPIREEDLGKTGGDM